MARVRLAPAGVDVEVEPGGRILDAVDARGDGKTVLPVRCRAANCATCLVRVRAGEALLAPPDAREFGVLNMVRATSDQRLGCQLRIVSDTGSEGDESAVVLSVVGPI